MCYGIIYGMGPKSLGIKIGKSESEAEKMMNDFKDSYPKMAQFLVKTITESGQGPRKFSTRSDQDGWPNSKI